MRPNKRTKIFKMVFLHCTTAPPFPTFNLKCYQCLHLQGQDLTVAPAIAYPLILSGNQSNILMKNSQFQAWNSVNSDYTYTNKPH